MREPSALERAGDVSMLRLVPVALVAIPLSLVAAFAGLRWLAAVFIGVAAFCSFAAAMLGLAALAWEVTS